MILSDDAFCSVNGIPHKTPAPYSPASNGQVERYVGTMKSALKKLSLEGGGLRENLARFLFRQHMVVSATGSSPSALMLGREIRSRLDLLKEKPTPMTPEQFDSSKMKYHRNEIVMVKDFRGRRPGWIAGKILKLIGNTMCIVETNDGIWRRHFNQLQKCSQDVPAPHLENPYDLPSSEDEAMSVEDDHASFHSLSEDEQEAVASEAEEDIMLEEHGANSSDLQESHPPSQQEEVGNLSDNVDTSDSSGSALRRSGRQNKGVPPEKYADIS